MEKDKITIIGIAGGTGSGKTTVVKKSWMLCLLIMWLWFLWIPIIMIRRE